MPVNGPDTRVLQRVQIGADLGLDGRLANLIDDYPYDDRTTLYYENVWAPIVDTIVSQLYGSLDVLNRQGRLPPDA